jgi:hypothetical protein
MHKVQVEAAQATRRPRVGFTDDELRVVIGGSRSWAEVIRKLGLSIGGGDYLRVQRAAVKGGIDTSHMFGQLWNRAPVQTLPVPFTKKYDEANLHRVGSAVATAWFMARGYTVSIPVEPARYDMVVESDAGLQRVQVKTSGNPRRVSITRTVYGVGTTPSGGKYGRRPYEADEIDLFFIYLASGEMFLIPLAAVLGHRNIALPRYAGYQLPA